MSLPAKSKLKADAVAKLPISATTSEARQAAVQFRDIANDSEVSNELRNRASQFAAALEAPPTAEDPQRREAKVAEATRWTSMNV